MKRTLAILLFAGALFLGRLLLIDAAHESLELKPIAPAAAESGNGDVPEWDHTEVATLRVTRSLGACHGEEELAPRLPSTAGESSPFSGAAAGNRP